MKSRVDAAAAAYDDIAQDYDREWSVHVRDPQLRLTRELQLSPGLRCADLGCGTGIDTLEMLRDVTPGEVLGVDCSPRMLQTAQQRARAIGLSLATRCQDVSDFLVGEPAASFDVLALRFILGYLDWRRLLPAMPRLLVPGGRVGILTIMSTSAPQAYQVYERLAKMVGFARVPRSGPESLAQITAGLTQGGAQVETQWSTEFRLCFPDGASLLRFLRESGLATHPNLDRVPQALLRMLLRRFAQELEAFRTPAGIPLDFQLAGVVARVG